MGWELWAKETTYGWTQIGFFCNTADESFGPVVSAEVDTEKCGSAWVRREIYNRWDEAVRFIRMNVSDPRSMNNHGIYMVCQAVFYLAGWQTGKEFQEHTGHELDIHGHIVWENDEE